MDYFLGDSECSSGCESGWTLYLDNSLVSPYDNGNNGLVGNGKCAFSDEKRTHKEEEEEEDMSMVSDASSGPPHFPEEEDYANDNSKCFYHAPVDATLCKNRAQKQKSRENKRRNEVHEKSSLLDDTASSPVFNLPSKNFKVAKNHASEAETLLDVSKGYSTTHFEGSSAYQDQYGFFQYPTLPGNYPQQNQWFGVGMWQQ